MRNVIAALAVACCEFIRQPFEKFFFESNRTVLSVKDIIAFAADNPELINKPECHPVLRLPYPPPIREITKPSPFVESEKQYLGQQVFNIEAIFGLGAEKCRLINESGFITRQVTKKA